MAANAERKFQIRALNDKDGVTSLSLGDATFTPLKTFLRKDAKSHQVASLARTYVAVEDGTERVSAYITVICGEIEVQANHDGEDLQYPYPRYPAVKIARLAVDRRLQGGGIGRQLVDLALGITREIISPNVGCRFLVVDAKQPSIKFYERYGFTSYGGKWVMTV
ncbi:GNAT family N-acetyltransferase [Mesorhizobium huakuii 7653R]|nr:GNAT family N-acetyltransferase [Mesorhizobium huakuii 7653R]